MTNPPSIEEGADLPELTDRQKKFVEALLAGNTGADAYRASHDCSAMQPNTIWVNAAVLKNNTKVQLWLAAGRKAYLGTQVVTLSGHLAELENLREIAIETGNVGAAVQAEQLRGKAAGHYVERLEVKHDDPMAIVREIASLSPAAAIKFAEQMGLEWSEPPETEH